MCGGLYRLPDPIARIKGLSKKLDPEGIFRIFIYVELGHGEIQLIR
ncbi:MAG: hypothetical protein ACQJCO_01795 [cyanobacterium endosymbiont of Rhopalodia sterrenbergii]